MGDNIVNIRRRPEFVLADAAGDLLKACEQAYMVMSVDGENDLEEWEATLALLETAIAKAKDI